MKLAHADTLSLQASIDEFKKKVHAMAMNYMQQRGLTAVPPKHIWLDTPESEPVVCEGFAPLYDRPAHLVGLDLDVCNFRVKGTVVKVKKP